MVEDMTTQNKMICRNPARGVAVARCWGELPWRFSSWKVYERRMDRHINRADATS